MQVFYHEYFKNRTDLFIAVAIFIGILSAYTTLNYYQYNANFSTDYTKNLFVIIFAILIPLTIAMSFRKRRTLQGLEMKIAFLCMIIDAVYNLSSLVIARLAAIIVSPFAIFSIVISLILLLVGAPMLLQILCALEYFSLLRLEKQNLPTEEASLDTRNQELVVQSEAQINKNNK